MNPSSMPFAPTVSTSSANLHDTRLVAPSPLDAARAKKIDNAVMLACIGASCSVASNLLGGLTTKLGPLAAPLHAGPVAMLIGVFLLASATRDWRARGARAIATLLIAASPVVVFFMIRAIIPALELSQSAEDFAGTIMSTPMVRSLVTLVSIASTFGTVLFGTAIAALGAPRLQRVGSWVGIALAAVSVVAIVWYCAFANMAVRGTGGEVALRVVGGLINAWIAVVAYGVHKHFTRNPIRALAAV